MEFLSGGELLLSVPVEGADHAHELGPIAGVDELPEAEPALALVRDPGVIADQVGAEKCKQLLPAQQRTIFLRFLAAAMREKERGAIGIALRYSIRQSRS